MDGVVAMDNVLLRFIALCADCQTSTELTVSGIPRRGQNQEYRPEHIKMQCPWCLMLLDVHKVAK